MDGENQPNFGLFYPSTNYNPKKPVKIRVPFSGEAISCIDGINFFLSEWTLDKVFIFGGCNTKRQCH